MLKLLNEDGYHLPHPLLYFRLHALPECVAAAVVGFPTVQVIFSKLIIDLTSDQGATTVFILTVFTEYCQPGHLVKAAVDTVVATLQCSVPMARVELLDEVQRSISHKLHFASYCPAACQCQ